MKRHNFWTVVRFEYIRVIGKVKYWILTLTIPIGFGLLIALSALGGSTAADLQSKQAEGKFDFAYSDASGHISAEIAKQMGGHTTSDAEAAIEQVKKGELEAFFDYPANLPDGPIEVFAVDQGLVGSDKYSAVAEKLLIDSIKAETKRPELMKILTANVPVQLQTFENGQPSGGLAAVLFPGIFLVLFYFSIILLGNQMLSITVEEKENRVTEMILTTMNPTTLILGKILAVVLIGITQTLVIVVPITIAYQIAGNYEPTSSYVNLGSEFTFPWLAFLMGALLFLAGFCMMIASLVAVGAVLPTVKEAGNAFGIVLLVVFIPLYFLVGLVSDPYGLVSQFMTFFPLTAPVAALVRNATGSLPWWQALIVVAEVMVIAIVVMRIGVRLFRTGSVSYGKKLNIRKALSARRGDA